MLRPISAILFISVCCADSVGNIGGPDAKIHMNGAVLTASCKSSEVGVKYLNVSQGEVTHEDDGDPIRSVFQHVAASCSGVTIADPCVSDDPNYPPLFHCNWIPAGSEEEVSTGLMHGPFAAKREADKFGEVQLGLRTFLDCPMPNADDIFAVNGGKGQGGDVPLELNVYFGLNTTFERILPFMGVPGANGITFTSVHAPSPPHPSPPPPPPPAQLTPNCEVHIWRGYFLTPYKKLPDTRSAHECWIQGNSDRACQRVDFSWNKKNGECHCVTSNSRGLTNGDGWDTYKPCNSPYSG